MSRGREVEGKSLGYSHTITTLACAALLSIWMLSMQSDYEAEQESICIAYHGKGAKWDRRVSTLLAWSNTFTISMFLGNVC